MVHGGPHINQPSSKPLTGMNTDESDQGNPLVEAPFSHVTLGLSQVNG